MDSEARHLNRKNIKSVAAGQAGSALPDSHTGDPKQELDADAIAWSKIPADLLVRPDPLAPFLRPIDRLANRSAETLPLKFGATYAFLNQYATHNA